MKTVAELRAQRAALIADAQLIAKKETLAVEDRTAFDNVMSQADAVGLDIQRVERMEAAEAEQRAFTPPARGQVGSETADTRTDEQRSVSYRNYLRTGKVETRDLTVAADGSVLVPQFVSNPVIARKFAGSIYNIVNVMKTATGAAVKVPLLNDTAQGFVLESASITTTDPTVGGETISIDDYRSNPILVDKSLIQDVGFDIAGFVNEAIATRYLRTVSSAMTLGNSSNVGGLTAITAGITSNTTLVLKYVDFTGMLVALDPAYAANACWTMSNATLGAALNIVDGNGRPIFVPYMDGANTGFVGQILGYPVKINPYMPAIASGAVSIQFGDHKEGYCFREVLPGPTVLRLEERYAELNRVGFVSFARIGGAVSDAGTHPVISLTGK